MTLPYAQHDKASILGPGPAQDGIPILVGSVRTVKSLVEIDANRKPYQIASPFPTQVLGKRKICPFKSSISSIPSEIDGRPIPKSNSASLIAGPRE